MHTIPVSRRGNVNSIFRVMTACYLDIFLIQPYDDAVVREIWLVAVG
jgi:hypothetical protein